MGKARRLVAPILPVSGATLSMMEPMRGADLIHGPFTKIMQQ